MFSSSELEGIPIPIQNTAAQLEDRIMEDLVMRIRESGEISSTADWRINRLKILGRSDKYIKEQLQHLLEVSEEEINRLYSDVLNKGYVRDKALYKSVGKGFIPLSKNKELQTLINAMRMQTSNEFTNITQTIGFAKRVNGKIQFTDLSKYYQETLDSAILDISTGTFSYDEVLKRVVNEMTNSGIRTVNFASGRSFRVESAVRTALMTGFNQTISKINDDLANTLDTDYFEVSYHGGARPEHQAWQGKVYSRKQLVDICGLGSVTGLLGANCYHSYFPFVPGASVRSYSDKQLNQMNAKENKPKSYMGKEYTAYEATQRQRQMELLMRKQRQDINLLQKGEANSDDIIAAKSRYRSTMEQYVEFSDKMGIPQQKQRVYVDGLGKLSRKSVVNDSGSDIIPLSDVLIHKSLGAAAFNYPVKLPNGKIVKLVEGTKITKVYVFAGKGTNKPIRVASHLSKQYGVPETEWKKVRGDGYIDEQGKARHVELHWFESKETGRIQMKVKRYFDES